MLLAFQYCKVELLEFSKCAKGRKAPSACPDGALRTLIVSAAAGGANFQPSEVPVELSSSRAKFQVELSSSRDKFQPS